MNWNGLLQFLHLVFAFSYVGSLAVAEWNSRAARATQDWSHRAALFQIVHMSTRVAGAVSLFLTGLLGHAMAPGAGFHMGQDRWMLVVTAVWLVALFLMFLINLPYSARLAAIARMAAGGGSSDGWNSTLARWRFTNILQSVLYIVLLALMVFSWHS